MVARQVTICDVYGVVNAKAIHVSVKYVGGSDQQDIVDQLVDLSPRALKRLVKNIEQGTTPPTERKKPNGS